MQSSQAPILKDLVLVGGGHSHVAVLKRFGMRPLAGVRVTLITRDVETPYSGMLPGLIAGHYDFDASHIDLRPLASFAGAQLFHTEAVGLDLDARQVLCADRPPVPFDIVSLDIGAAPALAHVPGAAEHALPVKPVDRLLAGWQAMAERARTARGTFRIVVVGGGAGGVELALALQHRLRAAGEGAGHVRFDVLTDTPDILPGHNARVRRCFRQVLASRGIGLYTDHEVIAVEPGRVRCAHGAALPFQGLIWATGAAAPTWIAHSGLATDARGFIAVNEALQSLSHPQVFAAGDIAAVVRHPRPKSGVFAVRQGPPLAANLRRALLGRRLKPFRPQRQALALISTGDRYAVASRGPWALAGRAVWRWKDRIDRRWMRRYQALPAMPAAALPAPAAGLAGPEAMAAISAVAMRCGGCGAKIGASVLGRVLGRLQVPAREDVLVGLGDPDDAAVVRLPPGMVAVHTVDFFRAFVDDPYLFGRIAANHALGDVFAMGATAQTALAMATLPYGLEAKIEAQLYDLLAGANEALNEAGAVLVGGHSGEGAELSFGLAVNGYGDPARLLRKGGLQPGQALVLTKPLGTGTLFAADMRRRAKGRWIAAALEAMLQSNRQAAACLFEHGASACTDVTGFGLLGHLVEMTRPSQVDAALWLDALPVLEGALETLRLGIFSSLQPENVRLRRAVRNLEQVSADPRYPLLFDPQTAGGLLAGLPAERAQACLAALHRLGYRQAAIVGQVQAQGTAVEPITVLTGAVQVVADAARRRSRGAAVS